MNHVFVNVEINLGAGHKFPLQTRGSLGPDNILHLMLKSKEMVPKLVSRHLHEASYLLQGHRGVQLQVRPDGWKHELLPHFLHEHLQLKPKGLLVHVFAIKSCIVRLKAWRHGREKFRTREREAGLELRDVSSLHFIHLLCVVLLPERGV